MWEDYGVDDFGDSLKVEHNFSNNNWKNKMEIAFSGLVLGLVQVVKITFSLSKRYVPVTALVVSLLVVGVAAYFEKVSLSWDVIQNALIAGLSSVGLWEFGKTSVMGK